MDIMLFRNFRHT
ncbi:hypothetical protein Zm00014a_012219 [Zea mays]|uniref:Uncharacterized protein n=1 Tax=Zea mays TaxID=4577 RepID=A0A3L6ES98_MAIZE|nr:hypothetical protein Zm00014a_012219 [Zea mays]